MPDVHISAVAGRAGLGHVGRMAALAEALLEHGADVTADVTGEDAGLLTTLVPSLAAPPTNVGWVVTDGPDALSLRRLSELQRAGRVCVVDDLGAATSQADLSLCPPTSAWGRVPDDRSIMGPDAVLVRREFTAGDLAPASPTGHVLLALGGTGNALAMRLAARLASSFDVVVLAPTAMDLPRGVRQVGGTPTSSSTAMAGAKLAVTGFGHTALEAAVLSLPTAIIRWEHQDEHEAASFAATWQTGRLVGASDSDPDHLALQIQTVLDDDAWWQACVGRLEIFHPHGADRVAQRLLSND